MTEGSKKPLIKDEEAGTQAEEKQAAETEEALPCPVPALPVLVSRGQRFLLLTPEGEVIDTLPEILKEHKNWPGILAVHAPSIREKLKEVTGKAASSWHIWEVAELFAFVFPAKTAAPSVNGLSAFLRLPLPGEDLTVQALGVQKLIEVLLQVAAAGEKTVRMNDLAQVFALQKSGWVWAVFLEKALTAPGDFTEEELGLAAATAEDAVRVWQKFPEREEEAPPPAAGIQGLTDAEVKEKLGEVLRYRSSEQHQIEERPAQLEFALACRRIFDPPDGGFPHTVIAEAGTGTGKTLGYLTSACLWAEKNQGTVRIATYTKLLQQQIMNELKAFFKDRESLRQAVVLRKGRENYVCLLNFEEAVEQALRNKGFARIPFILLARWLAASEDGALSDGDLPGWFSEIFPEIRLGALEDRHGECIYAACRHWRRCVIENLIKRSRQARLIVANHALMMSQGAGGSSEEGFFASHYIFDEGHHLFDAADSAFAISLSGSSLYELRRFLIGHEGFSGRMKGFQTRVADLLIRDEEAAEALHQSLIAAHNLPTYGWTERILPVSEKSENLRNPEKKPAEEQGFAYTTLSSAENFLRELCQTVWQRAGASPDKQDFAGDLECETKPVSEGLCPAAWLLQDDLQKILTPLLKVAKYLRRRLIQETASLPTATRLRIEATLQTLQRLAIEPLVSWQDMLSTLGYEAVRNTAFLNKEREKAADKTQKAPQFIDLIRLERSEGKIFDAAFIRHWTDPTIPLASALFAEAKGVLISSATLKEGNLPEGADQALQEKVWDKTEKRTGTVHLPRRPYCLSLQGNFDFQNRTRVFIVTDINNRQTEELASAYFELFCAAGGGALGLFTAISRLKQVYRLINHGLSEAGLPLYAQHVDKLGKTSLVDLFKSEKNSCLLGTDAMRDGIDVPGEALRLVVFERTPWPRPDILHRYRRQYLTDGHPKSYDDRLTELRLRQAFGRLIRRNTDKGIFVLTDKAFPSRLYSAFPPGVVPERKGLAEVIHEVKSFF